MIGDGYLAQLLPCEELAGLREYDGTIRLSSHNRLKVQGITMSITLEGLASLDIVNYGRSDTRLYQTRRLQGNAPLGPQDEDCTG